MYVCLRMFCDRFFILLCALGTPYANWSARHLPKKCGNAAMPRSGKNSVVKYSTVQYSLILQSVLIKTWPKPVTRARKICGAQGSLAVAASRELSGIREEWKPTSIHSRIAELPVLHFSNQDFSDSLQCWNAIGNLWTSLLFIIS